MTTKTSSIIGYEKTLDQSSIWKRLGAKLTFSSPRVIVKEVLADAGVHIGGSRSFDLQVHDSRFYSRFLANGSLGLGESYMDGWWDCEALDEFFYRILISKLDEKAFGLKNLVWQWIKAKCINLQSQHRSHYVAERHYDLGNELYECMLDKRMVYSCGYWKMAQTLDEAQEAKLDLICKKLQFQKGQRILDIGCGWGSFSKFAAENYGVEVVGITISREQVEYAKQLCQGLPVEIRLQDYRDIHEIFDHIVSIGMFEHVGCKNYPCFMRIVERSLKPEGFFLLHTVGQPTSYLSNDPWTHKYIFPNSMAPSQLQITKAIDGLFFLQDWHCFGDYYTPTLLAWHQNFNSNWPKLKNNYDSRFYRMWIYYLSMCIGLSRSRRASVWQIILSKLGYRNDIRAGF
jgi:cyclopropane-fatty-acyl-phospholipid synthase